MVCWLLGCAVSTVSGCAAAKSAPPQQDAGAIGNVENPATPASAGSAAAPPTDVTQPPNERNGDCTDENCACSEPGATRACWTGPAQQRGAGNCRDGKQTCNAHGAEFTTWGACEGQQLDCGVADAGPPPECGCIPGSMVSCDEDCSANIFCSGTAAKTCLPDGTWSACKETVDNSAAQAAINSVLGDGGIAGVLGTNNSAFCAGLMATNTSGISVLGVNALGLTCRNIYHGCCSSKTEGMYAGDCDKLFSCGHAPQ